jgi:hypothetical protein
MKAILLIGACALALTGCTTAQKERVENTAAAICASAPIAQLAYNTAVQNHDSATVNLVLNTLIVSCPSMLGLIHTIPVQTVAPPESILPAAGPERG